MKSSARSRTWTTTSATSRSAARASSPSPCSQMSATFTYTGEPVPPPVHLMDARSGAILTSFGMPDHEHSFVRFAPDGRTLLAACGKEALFVQVSATPRAVFRSRFAARAVEADFNPAGDAVALINKDGDGLVVRFSPAEAAAEIPLGAKQAGQPHVQPRLPMRCSACRNAESCGSFDPGSGAHRGWDGRRGRDHAVAACFAGDPERIVIVTRGGSDRVNRHRQARRVRSSRSSPRRVRSKDTYFSPDRRSRAVGVRRRRRRVDRSDRWDGAISRRSPPVRSW